MTQTTDPRPARFVAELSKLERGPLAQLRRGLGADERGTYWLESLILRGGYGHEADRRKDEHQRAILRLIAGLYALKPQARQDEGDGAEVETPEPTASADPEKGPSIGLLMGRLYLAQGERPSTEKRFLALLDADRDGLNHQMRQAVTLLATEDLTPDWVRLTRDLLYWGDRVRREWAQDFYREISRETKAQTDTPSAPSSDNATPTPQGAEQ